MTGTKSCARYYRARSERLEDRILLAGDFCVGDSVQSQNEAAIIAPLESSVDVDALALQIPDFHPLAAEISHAAEDLRERFQLDGRGQTVAVIDSGIAFDHDALGGGFGSEFRVVGGWDFTEPFDRSPYDDAPVGLHGTHVAGIIGSSDDQYPGIAPAVDFVALRIFDDRGYSRLDWLEAALQWVHENQHSFENPITTVNLSVRFDDSISEKQLSRIEDELRDLYEDNIFVAVAAGNDFSAHDPLEIGHPASSLSVVPVGSVNAENQLSSFSQRNARILAAPGESITSTAPDHIENANGRTDDFYTITGTSMAAPYVAGASVLVRQAMHRAGRDDVSQAEIYDHLRATSDLVYDSVTGLQIPVVNIDRAIDALIDEQPLVGRTAGRDDPASSHSVGGIDFTNARDLGVVDFKAIDLTPGDHALRMQTAREGTLTVVADGGRSSIRVFDAQSNSLLAESKIGRIDIQVDGETELVVQTELIANTKIRIANLMMERADSVIVGGTNRADHVTVDADVLSVNGVEYQIAAQTRSIELAESIGRDTLEITTDGDVDIQITGSYVDETERTIRSEMFEQVTVSRRSEIGGVATVTGSGGNDIVGASSERVVLRGGRFRFTVAGFAHYEVNSNGGRNDRIRFEGTAGDDRATGRQNEFQFTTSQSSVLANDFDQLTVEAGRGQDTAMLVGGDQDSSVYASPDLVRRTDRDASMFLRQMEEVSIDAGEGADVIRIVGSDSQDSFEFRDAKFDFTSPNIRVGGDGFETVSVYGRGGDDRSVIFATPEPDRIDMTPQAVSLENDDIFVSVRQFEFNTVETDGRGDDHVYLEDSTGADVFIATDEFARMSGVGYQNVARGFASIVASSTHGGDDVASLFDSDGDDSVFSGTKKSFMLGEGFRNEIRGFNRMTVRANRGTDRVVVEVDGRQRLTGNANRLVVSDSNSIHTESTLIGFDEVIAFVEGEAEIDVDSVDYLFSFSKQ